VRNNFYDLKGRQLPVKEGMKLVCTSSPFYTGWVGKIFTVEVYQDWYIVKTIINTLISGKTCTWEICNTNEDITDWL